MVAILFIDAKRYAFVEAFDTVRTLNSSVHNQLRLQPQIHS